MATAIEKADERKERWRRFLAPDGPPGCLVLIRWTAADETPRPPLWPARRAERIEWIWRDYQRQLRRVETIDDDFVPHMNMLTGTEIFAEAFGCQVHRPADNMPFALPLIQAPADVARVEVPELNRSSLAYLFDMADELRRRAGPQALFRLPDIQSPMDIAALIMDKAEFLAAMIEAPEAINELAAKTRELLTGFLDEWFRRYGNDFVAHFPEYCLAGGVTLSEDEIGAVSPDMFAEFFAPELTELSRRYHGIGIHCCAHARHQWPQLRQIPGLRLLNLVQPRLVTTAAYSYFAGTCAQMHGQIAEGPIASWPVQYPSQARIVLELAAASINDGNELVRQVRQAWPLTAPL